MEKFIYKVFLKISIGIVVLLSWSCKEIIEEDLSSKQMDIIIPQNNYTTANRNVKFKWEEVKGATNYRIQIVSPAFNAINTFILDSLVTNTSITIQLAIGEYEWRVKGLNYNFETPYSVSRKIKIDSSYDLMNQSVVLINPLQNGYSNALNLNVTWNPIAEAAHYFLQLKSGTDFNTGSIVYEKDSITSTSETISNLIEGNYVLGIKAKNNLPSETNFTTTSFIIDTTKPSIPTLISPLQNDVYSTSVITFKWQIPIYTSSEAPIDGIVEIYSDSLTTLYQSFQTQADSLKYTFPQTGEFYWRMKFIDRANNIGSYSNSRKFTLN